MWTLTSDLPVEERKQKDNLHEEVDREPICPFQMLIRNPPTDREGEGVMLLKGHFSLTLRETSHPDHLLSLGLGRGTVRFGADVKYLCYCTMNEDFHNVNNLLQTLKKLSITHHPLCPFLSILTRFRHLNQVGKKRTMNECFR